jgi:conjugative transfer signal peptidase TraF
MQRRVLSIGAAALVAGCVLEGIAAPNPLLVWNATASAPVGLYRRQFGPVERQDWVLVRAPRTAADLAATRGYLPQSVPLVKRVAAQFGDRVCRNGGSILVNGRLAARALLRDAKGRNLPVWSGCTVLGCDQVFLLAPASASFDSRYFGPVPLSNVIERIAPLWTS